MLNITVVDYSLFAVMNLENYQNFMIYYGNYLYVKGAPNTIIIFLIKKAVDNFDGLNRILF